VVAVPDSSAGTKGTGLWSSIRRLKNRFPYHPDEGQGCKQAAITAFFLLVAMIPGVGRFFNNLLEYYSDVVRKSLNFAGEFLRGLSDKRHFRTIICSFIPLKAAKRAARKPPLKA
jgi:hypothetical protein